MRYYLRNKAEISHVPVITPTPIPFKPEHSNAAYLLMVKVLSRVRALLQNN